jgi:hypothetical protein
MRTTLAAALLLALPLSAASAAPPSAGCGYTDPAGDVELGSTGVAVPAADHVDILGFDAGVGRHTVVVRICLNGPAAPARDLGFDVSLTAGRGVALAIVYQPCAGRQAAAVIRNGNVLTVIFPITVTGSHPRVTAVKTEDYVRENAACAATGLSDHAEARP